MDTNEIVVSNVKEWLSEKDERTYQWLAEQLGVSKSLVGFMLSGERALQPKRIEKLAQIMGISVKDLLHNKNKVENKGSLTYELRGATSNRRSKRELDILLFAIEDYIGLKEQVD